MSDYGSAVNITWIALMWAVVVGLGILVGYYGFRIYARTHQRSMGFLSAGFVLISAAAGLVWFLMYYSGMSLYQCELGSTGLTAVGFASILYSLRTKSP